MAAIILYSLFEKFQRPPPPGGYRKIAALFGGAGAPRGAGSLVLIVVGITAVFSFGASAYCLFALTGVAGFQTQIGVSSCEIYFQALSALLTPTIAAAAP